MSTEVNCPNCGKKVLWDAQKSPFRPFCCERCKLSDFGDWANEKHTITADEEGTDWDDGE